MPLFFLGLNGCGGTGNETPQPTALNRAELGSAVDGAVVTVTTREGRVLSTVSQDGLWSLPQSEIPDNDEEKLYVQVQKGLVGGREINGTMAAWVDAKGLREGRVTVDIATTFAAYRAEYLNKNDDNLSEILDGVARTLLYAEANGSADFRTLYGCDDDADCVGAKARLFDGGVDAFVYSGEAPSVWMEGDGDGDGVVNGEEAMLWLLPNNLDTDGDTLNDGDELYTFSTRPQQSDSDDDFIPDPMEVSSGSDPNDADENVNGIPDGLEGDPFFDYQWHLYNPESLAICNTADIATVAGNDLAILPLYHRTLGALHAPQTVQVVDGGVDYPHEDLAIDLNRSWNSITHTTDPAPTGGISSDPVRTFYRGHGTAVAGIIAAKAMNGLGVRGVAPQVGIAGNNWLESEAIEELSTVWLGGDDTVTISNNSWGARYLKESIYEPLLEEAVGKFRGGKGRLFVFAAGNDREQFGNSNLSYLTNNPFVIAVAAVNHENKFSSYSSPGANVLVSAYGGEHYYTAPTIMTTFTPHASMDEATLAGAKGPITLDEDTQRSYTYAMNGTSAAAPMVSGALALVLDLCPDLGYRDVIRLIALTSRRIDKQNSSWTQNAAGLWHSNDYGYGMIDPQAMVERCRSKTFAQLPEQHIVTAKASFDPIALTDDNTTYTVALTVDENLTIEWVGITPDIDHPYVGDIAVELVSPSGTVSTIVEPNFINFNAYTGGFRFSSVAFKEEPSAGVWQLKVRDALEKDSGTLKGAKITIRGYTR